MFNWPTESNACINMRLLKLNGFRRLLKTKPRYWHMYMSFFPKAIMLFDAGFICNIKRGSKRQDLEHRQSTSTRNVFWRISMRGLLCKLTRWHTSGFSVSYQPGYHLELFAPLIFKNLVQKEHRKWPCWGSRAVQWSVEILVRSPTCSTNASQSRQTTATRTHRNKETEETEKGASWLNSLL